jgi:hypothetical protein
VATAGADQGQLSAEATSDSGSNGSGSSISGVEKKT